MLSMDREKSTLRNTMGKFRGKICIFRKQFSILGKMQIFPEIHDFFPMYDLAYTHVFHTAGRYMLMPTLGKIISKKIPFFFSKLLNYSPILKKNRKTLVKIQNTTISQDFFQCIFELIKQCNHQHSPINVCRFVKVCAHKSGKLLHYV